MTPKTLLAREPRWVVRHQYWLAVVPFLFFVSGLLGWNPMPPELYGPYVYSDKAWAAFMSLTAVGVATTIKYALWKTSLIFLALAILQYAVLIGMTIKTEFGQTITIFCAVHFLPLYIHLFADAWDEAFKSGTCVDGG